VHWKAFHGIHRFQAITGSVALVVAGLIVAGCVLVSRLPGYDYANILLASGNSLVYSYSCIMLSCVAARAIRRATETREARTAIKQQLWPLAVSWVIDFLATGAALCLIRIYHTEWFLLVSFPPFSPFPPFPASLNYKSFRDSSSSYLFRKFL
jgi:L-asparagine transporter-like permease